MPLVLSHFLTIQSLIKQTQKQTHTHTNTHTHIHKQKHTYTNKHMHTHTHTNWQAQRQRDSHCHTQTRDDTTLTNSDTPKQLDNEIVESNDTASHCLLCPNHFEKCYSIFVACFGYALNTFLEGCTTFHRIALGLHTFPGTFRAARGVIPPTLGFGGPISVHCVVSPQLWIKRASLWYVFMLEMRLHNIYPKS